MTEDEEELRMERDQEHREEALQEQLMFHNEEFFLQNSAFNEITELLEEFRKQCEEYGYISTDYFKEMY